MAIILVPPSAEPLSLAEAKAMLRVESGDDDAVIAALIQAARGHVEALTRRVLMLQTWRIVRDAWPVDGRIALRSGPLRAVLAARVFDASGEAHAIDVQNFGVDDATDTIASPGWALPPPERSRAGIELDVELGFGALAADVPAPLRQALRMMAAGKRPLQQPAIAGRTGRGLHDGRAKIVRSRRRDRRAEFFPMLDGGTGLAGEAGPEAIMPLQRRPDGRLGVAGSGGNNIHLQIATPDPESFRRSENYITGQIARAVARGQRSL